MDIVINKYNVTKNEIVLFCNVTMAVFFYKLKKITLLHHAKHFLPPPFPNTFLKPNLTASITIGRASLVFIFRDVTRFMPLLARLVQ